MHDTNPTPDPRAARTRSLVSALVGAVVYGSWGFAANYSVSLSKTQTVALAQGTFSFVLSLLLTGALERLWRRFRSVSIATCIALAVTYPLVILVHVCVGTPRIIVTMAPGTLMTGIFVVLYLLNLRRVSKPSSEG